MNNSDIISALSLALTAIIFLLQTDDGLLKLKITSNEKWVILFSLVGIILLANYQVFERMNITFYFSIVKFYLLPTEWALIIFLILQTLILIRIFSPKIINKDPQVIFGLIKKYRAEKKISKLENLVWQIIKLKDFETKYAEKLENIVFNDHHLIEYFSSNCPELLIEFTKSHENAAINKGEYFYNILNGLFLEKGNQIYSEIRQYQTEPEKSKLLNNWEFDASDFVFDENKNYKTNQEIIEWLIKILMYFPHNLKEEVAYFLKQFKDASLLNNNHEIYSEDEINKILSRDTLFNAIQLFRILLIELSIVDKRTVFHIDRPLLIFYSSWDFLQNSTRLESEKVHLDNDSYTINEYLLKYLFDSYCSLYVLNQKILVVTTYDNDKEKEDTTWIFHQLFRKLDSLIATSNISDKSKKYYISELIGFYFEMPEYFKDIVLVKSSEAFLNEMKYSLEESNWGNPAIFRILFENACKEYEFYRANNKEGKKYKYRAKEFYEYLLPYTKDLEYRICDT